MMVRSLVASVFGFCCLIVVLSPDIAFARSGGLAVGRGLMLHGAALRPGRSLLRSGVRPAPLAKSRFLSRAFPAQVVAAHGVPVQVRPIQRFRRVFGARLPRNGIGIFYGSAYPDEFSGTYSRYALPQTVADTAPLSGRRCDSQTVIVPAESGGERPITVTRCWSE